jgi:anti-anti-sigma regulatory factor
LCKLEELRVLRDGPSLTIVGVPVMDVAVADAFKQAVKAALESSQDITVDLRPATFVESSILQTMAVSNRRLRKAGSRLRVLVSKGSYAQRILTLLGLGDLMNVEVSSSRRNQGPVVNSGSVNKVGHESAY